MTPMIREKVARPLLPGRESLDALHEEIDRLHAWGVTAAYADKQLHPIPQAPVIDRVAYIVARCKAQRVLNIGSASGTLHAAIKAVATSVIGVDHENGPNVDVWLDLDEYAALQAWRLPAVDLIVFAETLEHVLLPGAVLRKLREAQAPLLVTTPNAYASGSIAWVKRGYENINREHSHIYSYHSLKVMLERTGWTPEAWAGYGGTWPTQEGLIVLAT